MARSRSDEALRAPSSRLLSWFWYTAPNTSFSKMYCDVAERGEGMVGDETGKI